MGLKKHYKKKVGKGFLASALLVSMISPSIVAVAEEVESAGVIEITGIGKPVTQGLKETLNVSDLTNTELILDVVNGEGIVNIEGDVDYNILSVTSLKVGSTEIKMTLKDKTTGDIITTKTLTINVKSEEKDITSLTKGEQIFINGDKYILLNEKERKFVKVNGIELDFILQEVGENVEGSIGNDLVDKVLSYLNTTYLNSTMLINDISEEYYNYDSGNNTYLNKSQISFLSEEEIAEFNGTFSFNNVLLRNIENGKNKTIGSENPAEIKVHPVIILDKDTKIVDGIAQSVNTNIDSNVSLIGNNKIAIESGKESSIDLTSIIGNKRGDSFIYTIDSSSTNKFTQARIDGDYLKVKGNAEGTDNLKLKVYDTLKNTSYVFDLELISNDVGTQNSEGYKDIGEEEPVVNYTEDNKSIAKINLSNITGYNSFRVINNSGNSVEVSGNEITVLNNSLVPTNIYVELSNSDGLKKVKSFSIDAFVPDIIEEPPVEEPPVEEPPVEEPPVEEPPVEEPPVEEPPVEEPPVEEPPVVEVPVITGTVAKQDVNVGSEVIVDLKVLHEEDLNNFVYKIENTTETLIETKFLEGGYLVIKGLAVGEGIVKISLENEAGSSDVIEIKSNVKAAESLKTSVSKVYGVGSSEELSLSQVVNSTYLNDSSVTYKLEKISNNFNASVSMQEGILYLLGNSEGETSYNLEVVKDGKVIHTYELKVLVSKTNFGLKDTTKPKVELRGTKSKTELNLSDYFVGTSDKTVYTVVSGSKNIASLNVVNGNIIIEGLNIGQDTLSVRAKDGNVSSGVLDIEVNVKSEEINKDLKITTSEKYHKAVTSLFTDLSSGSKLVSLKTESSDLVSISLEDDLIAFRALENGKDTIKLTGTDSLGKTHIVNLSLEVNVSDLETKTKELKLTDKVEKEYIRNIFENVTSGTKIKSINVENNSLVDIELDGDKLEFTALKNGTDTIEVTLKDENNKEYNIYLKITTDVKELVILNETIKLSNETTEVLARNIFKNVPTGADIESVNAETSSFVDISFKDNKLILKALKNGSDTVKLIATDENNKKYTVYLKVTNEVESLKIKEGIKFTSSTYEGTIDFTVLEGTVGSKLKEELVINLTDSKLTYEISGIKSTVDIKIDELKKDKVYLFMKVNGELIPLNATVKNDGSYDVKLKYAGKIIVSNEQEGFSNIFGHYAEDYITELASKKILEDNWTGGSKFGVNEKVKSSEFTKVLSRSLGLIDSDGKEELSKIINNKHYNNASSTVNREDAMVALFDIIKSKDKTIREVTTSNFTDFDKVSSNAKTSVATLQNLGIIHGKPVGNTDKRYFDGEDTLTRAQLSKIIALSLRHFNK